MESENCDFQMPENVRNAMTEEEFQARRKLLYSYQKPINFIEKIKEYTDPAKNVEMYYLVGNNAKIDKFESWKVDIIFCKVIYFDKTYDLIPIEKLCEMYEMIPKLVVGKNNIYNKNVREDCLINIKLNNIVKEREFTGQTEFGTAEPEQTEQKQGRKKVIVETKKVVRYVPLTALPEENEQTIIKMNKYFENIKVKRMDYLNERFPLPKREEFKFENVIDLGDFE